MAKKVPKYQEQLEVTKSPKNIENPSQYKELPVAWQICYIDGDGKWGLNILREHYTIGHYEELLSELPNDIHNDLLSAIDELIGKRFLSINSLLDSLQKKSNQNVTIAEQKIILNYLLENPFWTGIYSKLQHFEMSSWHEIEREQYGRRGKSKHHNVSISDIIPEAQKRLRKLNLDDIDQLFSIRLSGTLRIWGIRKFSFFRVLWFDFNHEICPVDKS